MGQKYLIIPTQHFSGGLKGHKFVGFDDLPNLAKTLIRWANKLVHVILDESSWIRVTQVTAEEKKSQRTRLIKVLTKYTSSRNILTATLKSKSPMNLIDQYQFLDQTLFDDDPYVFAETYCILETLKTARGRRVIISQKTYEAVRASLKRAWNFGLQYNNAEKELEATMVRLSTRYGINFSNQWHIIAHRTYTPFINQQKLMSRVADITTTIKREDVFDISKDEYIYNPIKRPVPVSEAVKKLGNELVRLGFTDNLVLGKAPALELTVRLQDLCNGFEPVKTEKLKTKRDGSEVVVNDVTYIPLKENPKLDMMETILEEVDAQRNQVVILCSRTNAFDSISKRLDDIGLTYVRYSGSESTEKKKEAEELYETREVQVFLANQASAAYGLNCLADAGYLIEYCNDSSVEHHYQAKHRLLRGESKRPKFAYQIFVKGSVEERVIASLNVGNELLSDNNTKSVFVFK